MEGDIFKQMAKRAFGGTAVDRKRPASPTESGKPKKPVVAANGLSQGQTSASSQLTGPTPDQVSGTTAPLLAPEKAPKIPVIFMDEVPSWPDHLAKMRAAAGDNFDVEFRGKNFRLKASTVPAFRALQRYLCSTKLPFHTFNFKGGRSLKVVISGLPQIEDLELCDILTDKGFAVDDLHLLNTYRGPSRSWVVILGPDCDREMEDTKRAAEIYGLTHLCHVRVKVTPYRRPAGPIQCHRCQAFGHGSANCYRPPRCVRCGGPHLRKACDKPPEEKGLCCNCGEPHNASYRGCDAYQKARRVKTGANLRDTGKPAPPQAKRPAQGQEPLPQTAADGEASDYEDGFVPVRKRRKRPPRNPANRLPRPQGQHVKTTARAEEEPAPRARATPRKRLDWPPKPVTRERTPVPEPPQAAAELPATEATSEGLIKLLGKLAQQLAAACQLLNEAISAFQSSQA